MFKQGFEKKPCSLDVYDHSTYSCVQTPSICATTAAITSTTTSSAPETTTTPAPRLLAPDEYLDDLAILKYLSVSERFY